MLGDKMLLAKARKMFSGFFYGHGDQAEASIIQVAYHMTA